jgi:hypothetical protein
MLIYCTIVVPIVVHNFDSGSLCQSTKTSPFRPEMSMNAETTPRPATFLLEGNESRRVGGTNTGPTVLDGLV